MFVIDTFRDSFQLELFPIDTGDCHSSKAEISQLWSIKLVSHQTITHRPKKSADCNRKKNQPIFFSVR